MDLPIPSSSNLIGIIVCVNFADKLKPALEHNKKFFKKFYIATDPTDFDTFDATKNFSKVELVISDVAKIKDAKFNKSGLMLAAQKKAHEKHPNDWMVVLDADTLLPDNFWDLLEKQKTFKKDTCYLLKRAIFFTKTSYESNTPDKTSNGAGFFQLYHDKVKYYPAWSNDAGLCDIIFQNKFNKQKELNGWCKHLGQNGLDWQERKSPQWA